MVQSLLSSENKAVGIFLACWNNSQIDRFSLISLKVIIRNKEVLLKVSSFEWKFKNKLAQIILTSHSTDYLKN